jgi:hypothetical protein
MEIHTDSMPGAYMTDLLNLASSIIGLPVADVEALLSSELDTHHLLVYISAMMSDRMN